MKHLTQLIADNGGNPALAFRQGHFEQTSYGRIYIPPSDKDFSREEERQFKLVKSSED